MPFTPYCELAGPNSRECAQHQGVCVLEDANVLQIVQIYVSFEVALRALCRLVATEPAEVIATKLEVPFLPAFYLASGPLQKVAAY